MSPPAKSGTASDARSLWRTVVKPRSLGLLALALAAAAVMSVLGSWQLNVYQSKTEAATSKRAEAAPVPLESLFPLDAGLPSKAVGRRVTVSGTWGPAADQILVSDRQQEGRNGFWVVTPLLLQGTSAQAPAGAGAVMVVRGWVPDVTSASARPPAGAVRIVGAVAASEAEDASAAAAGGRILPSLRIPTIVDLVDYRLYDAFVVLISAEPPVADGPVIVPAPTPPTDHAGLRNVAYAVQWWIFAVFALWMWARVVLDAHRAGDDQPSGTVSE
jgi:cytochrome oxidase assembly protein ShyY1